MIPLALPDWSIWIFFGVVCLFIILAAVSKKHKGPLVGISIMGVLILVFAIATDITKGKPITSLPHGKTFVTVCSQQLNEGDIDYAILYLAEIRSDKSLGEPKFYKIETWRLIDKNKERISKLPFIFEVLKFTDSIINENADKPWLKVQEQTLYCLIPRN